MTDDQIFDVIFFTGISLELASIIWIASTDGVYWQSRADKISCCGLLSGVSLLAACGVLGLVRWLV